MNDLSLKKCVPCEAGTPPMPGDKIMFLINQVPGWEFVEESKLSKNFKFRNFADALKFVNDVGAIAEEEGHHPDIQLSWGRVGIILFTHKIKGLSENDFIMASKINDIYEAK